VAAAVSAEEPTRHTVLEGRHATAPAEQRTEPVLVCDGGDAVWGALYDPATKIFRDLAFNGRA